MPKITSMIDWRRPLAERWFDLIDLDARRAATGDATIERWGGACSA
jgi:hypothetical protein